MKKLNFKNQVIGDDEKLIRLLKESTRREPSEKFVENTLEKFLALEARQKKLHTPLKLPLYIMLVIGVILLAPVLFSFSSQIALIDPGFELDSLIENISLQLDSWYTLSLIILVLVLISTVWIELGLVKFRKPFLQ